MGVGWGLVVQVSPVWVRRSCPGPTGDHTAGVRSRPSRGPWALWWVVAVVMAFFVGGYLTAVGIQTGRLWSVAVPGGVVSGVLLGVVLGRWAAHQRTAQSLLVEGLDRQGRRRAVRAVTRGPSPSDPRVRAAAHGLASDQLAQLDRQRPWAVPFFGVGVVGYTAAALGWSPWWWLPAASFAALFIALLVLPARMRRRLTTLTAAPR